MAYSFIDTTACDPELCRETPDTTPFWHQTADERKQPKFQRPSPGTCEKMPHRSLLILEGGMVGLVEWGSV
jgi:hypothetical protein